MKNIKTLILLLLIASSGFGQSLSPRVTATAGGRATGGGVSLSYTTGETFNTKLSANNKQLTQGQQQPEIDLRLGISILSSYFALYNFAINKRVSYGTHECIFARDLTFESANGEQCATTAILIVSKNNFHLS